METIKLSSGNAKTIVILNDEANKYYWNYHMEPVINENLLESKSLPTTEVSTEIESKFIKTKSRSAYKGTR